MSCFRRNLVSLMVFLSGAISVLAGEASDEPLALGMYTWVGDQVPKTLDPDVFPYLFVYGIDGLTTEEAVAHYLDRAVGFRVIFSLKDKFQDSRWFSIPNYCRDRQEEVQLISCMAGALEDKSGIHGWYLVDEPTLTMKKARFRRILDASKALSRKSSKPVFVEDIPKSASWDTLALAGDVLMTSAYPGTRGNYFAAYTLFRDMKARHPDKKVWAVLQAFDNGHYRKRMPHHRAPTMDELSVLSHLVVAAGVDGVVFFSLRDLERRPDTTTFRDMNELGRDLILLHERLADSPIRIETDPEARVLNAYSGKERVLRINAKPARSTPRASGESGEAEPSMSVWKHESLSRQTKPN